MPRSLGMWLLFMLLVRSASAPAQDAPAADRSASATGAVEQFDALRAQWAKFSLDLDKARYRVNNCPPEQKNEAVLAYDTLLEQGNELLRQFSAASVAAYEADPTNTEAERYLQTMIEHTLAADRYEDVLRMTQAVIAHGKPDAKLYEQAALASLEIGDLDAAERMFAECEKLGALSDDAKQKRETIPEWREKLAREAKLREAEAQADNLPRVTLVTTKGDIVLELYEDQAPNTVANFVALAERKFYNGLEFFRVENGFAAVAGCPLNRGTGGPGHEIVCETDRDDRRPALRGTISMVNAGRGRCGSPFFIALASSGVRNSEAGNPVFGRVIAGMDVVERLRRVDPDTTSKDFPRERVLDTRIERRRDHEYLPVTTFDIGKAKEAEALALMKASKYDEAEAVLAEGLEVAPWWYNLRYRMGILKLERGEAAAAIPHLSRAARMAPREPDPHLYLALAYAKSGDSANAKVNFEKVLKLRPNDTQAMKGLGVVLTTERRFRQAIEQFQAALGIDPDDREAQQFLNTAGELLAKQQASK
jgi:cyclophilin family peptidyl-prolyl cis-trans isomerase